MKQLISILIIALSVSAFAQAPKDASQKKDTLSVLPNAIQFDRIGKLQEKLNADQKEFGNMLELIFGVRIEEVEWWGFKQGKFLFTLKQKPNGKKTD